MLVWEPGPYNWFPSTQIMIDRSISTLPLRQRDHSRVFEDNKARKIDYVESETIYILREGGVEPQIRLECTKCRLPLFYRNDQKHGVTFIIEGSLVSTRPENSQTKAPLQRPVRPPSKSTTVTPSNKPTDNVPSSYSYNAAIINDYLQKRKHGEDDQDANSRKKRPRGTLLDH